MPENPIYLEEPYYKYFQVILQNKLTKSIIDM